MKKIVLAVVGIAFASSAAYAAATADCCKKDCCKDKPAAAQPTQPK